MSAFRPLANVPQALFRACLTASRERACIFDSPRAQKAAMLTIQGGAIEALSSRLRTELARRTQILAGDRVGPLVAEIDGYVDQVRSALSRNEFLNIDLAQRIASVLKILLSAYSEIASDHVKALIVGAARFFLETNDLWADLDSPLGFDDDADVLNAVLRDIRREDLLIDK